MIIPHKEWQWYGGASHFICGDRCQFHLSTVIGDVIISTIGEMISEPIKSRTFETIGCDRLYETMVFKAGEPCNEKDCMCGERSAIHDGCELDFAPYNDRKSATEGHAALCERWADTEYKGERS